MRLFTDIHLKTGTAGGTMLALVVNINAADLLRTAVLATVGAVISFTVSMLLKLFIRWVRRH